MHEQIKQLRDRAKASGLSVRAWCARAGVQQSTYYRWLKGRNGPSLRTITKLENAIP